MKQSLDSQRQELNECRAEITSLKMHIEGARSGRNFVASDLEGVDLPSADSCREEIKVLQNEIQRLKLAADSLNSESPENMNEEARNTHPENEVEKSSDHNIFDDSTGVSSGDLVTADSQLLMTQTSADTNTKPEEVVEVSLDNGIGDKSENVLKHAGELPSEAEGLILKPDSLLVESNAQKIVSSLRYIHGDVYLVKFLLGNYALVFLDFAGFGDYSDPFRCIAKNCTLCIDQPSRGMFCHFSIENLAVWILMF